MLKISFCTVCMNRLQHLKQTLQANIDDNKDYENLEFVLLDYNSKDGLEDYILNNMADYIGSGKLIYYKTLSHQYFNRSHSRNVAFRLATGDVICNIDADNFTGKGFAAYVNNEFNNGDNLFLSVFNGNDILKKADVFGRICVRRDDFHKVAGYDERMVNYGFEDYDLVNRLELAGLTKTPITGNADFFRVINHERNTRLENEYLTNNIKSILINYLSPSSSDVLLLFNDNTYKHGVVVDNHSFQFTEPVSDIHKTQLQYQYSILEGEWVNGEWSSENNHVKLQQHRKASQTLFFDSDKQCYTTDGTPSRSFYQAKSNDLIEEIIMFCSQVTNRIYMWRNKLNKTYIVNDNYGNDTLYKNLDFKNPIQI